MKDILNKILKIDRRWLFLLLTLSILIPIIKPIGISSSSISSSVQNMYDFVEKIPSGSTVFLGIDYDPSTAPELHPQAVAVMKHLFKKDIKVVVLTFIAGSGGLMDELIRTVPPQYGKVYGKDYVVLPYMPNHTAVLTQMASDMYAIYDKDINNQPLKDYEMMKNVKNYKDFAASIEITGTALLDGAWLPLVGDKYGLPILGGVTAISQVGLGPYLQKKQIKGLIGGMKGASEYERLIGEQAKATSGIDALNIAHLLVIFFIIFSNIVLLILKFY